MQVYAATILLAAFAAAEALLPTTPAAAVAAPAPAAPAPQDVDTLVAALSPQRPLAERVAAVEAISKLPDPDRRLLEPLLDLLQPTTPTNLARPAARAIGGFRDHPAALRRLGDAALGDGPLPYRQAAAYGLARIPTKASAEILVMLVDGDAPEALEREAGAALAEMTGLRIAATDVDGWSRWWQRARALDPDRFAATLLPSRASAAEADARRAAGAMTALLAATRQHHRSLDAGGQQAKLQELLASPSPELREVGAELALEDANFAVELRPATADLARRALLDPEPRVRRLAAQVASRTGDRQSLPLLVGASAAEPDAAARLAQVEAMSSFRTPEVFDALAARVADSVPGVRAAAARGLAELAVETGDPDLRRRAALRLRDRFELLDTTSRAGRRARRDLLIPLTRIPEPGLVTLYRDLLTSRTHPPDAVTREAALRGLAVIGDRRTGDIVAAFSGDEDPRVREAAAVALGPTSNGFERAEMLWQMTDPRIEPSDAVREASWATLVGLFPDAPVAQLARWPDRLRSRGDDPARRVTVLQVLATRAEAAGDGETLAYRRQELADVFMHDLGRPEEAVPLYLQSLEFSLRRDTTPVTIQVRTGATLRAMFRAQRFEQSQSFVAQVLARSPEYVQDLGSIVKDEAQRFVTVNQPQHARALIDTALAFEPPLDARTRRQLQDVLQTLP